jgi:hypothetical protein
MRVRMPELAGCGALYSNARRYLNHAGTLEFENNVTPQNPIAAPRPPRPCRRGVSPIEQQKREFTPHMNTRAFPKIDRAGGSVLRPAGLAFAALLAGSLAAMPAQAQFKCWTNNEGVRECGDRVPPEYAQEGHEVIKQGFVIDEKERAKTPEELEEDQRIRAEEAAAKRAEQERIRQDRILLSTFTSVEDIERVRDDRIRALDATISVTKARTEKIRQDLDKRVATAAAEERAGKEPNEALQKDIDSLRRQLADNESFIEEKHREQEEIRVEYAAHAARFEELKGSGRR